MGKDGSRLELDFEKVGEIGELGIANNGNVNCDIIYKPLMQETIGRLILWNEEGTRNDSNP